MIARALARPMRTAVLLAGGVAVAGLSLVAGNRAFDEGWSAAAWVAWLSGTLPFLIPGLVLWLLLLIPSGRIEAPWTRKIASLVLIAVGLGTVLQLLDDHVMGHAGTDNPLGFSIPFQDYLQIPVMALLALGALGTVVTLPGRVLRHGVVPKR